MYKVETQEMSREFLQCWQAAGMHINQQFRAGLQSWLKATPYPPFLEHLSFRFGNQLFFVRVHDVDEKVDGPGSLMGLESIAKGCSGYACIMPMKRGRLGDWAAIQEGWGLLDARTEKALNPESLVTAEKIEMTQWELQDFAVQVVRQHLEHEGFKLMSWQGNPQVDPSIWFVGGSEKPEWVVVRAARYPESAATRPGNWADIASGCAGVGQIGHFASVAFVSVDQPFTAKNEVPVPLWRGHGVHVRFEGLTT